MSPQMAQVSARNSRMLALSTGAPSGLRQRLFQQPGRALEILLAVPAEVRHHPRRAAGPGGAGGQPVSERSRRGAGLACHQREQPARGEQLERWVASASPAGVTEAASSSNSAAVAGAPRSSAVRAAAVVERGRDRVRTGRRRPAPGDAPAARARPRWPRRRRGAARGAPGRRDRAQDRRGQQRVGKAHPSGGMRLSSTPAATAASRSSAATAAAQVPGPAARLA